MAWEFQIRTRSKTKATFTLRALVLNSDLLLRPDLNSCCYGCTGSRNQGSHFDSHHGDPLWGGHAGHSSGIHEELWEISVHSHICECLCSHPSNYGLHFLKNENYRSIIIFVIELICIYRETLQGIIRNYCWSSAVEATRSHRWSRHSEDRKPRHNFDTFYALPSFSLYYILACFTVLNAKPLVCIYAARYILCCYYYIFISEVENYISLRAFYTESSGLVNYCLYQKECMFWMHFFSPIMLCLKDDRKKILD